MKYFILILSFLLDGILTNFLGFMPGNLTLFTPMLTITSLVLIYPYYEQNNKQYLITIFILGVLYDLFYTNLFLASGLIFLVLGFLIKVLYKQFSMNWFKVIIYTVLTILIYELSIVLFILLFNLVPMNIERVIYKLSHSLLLNIIYAEIFYLLLRLSKRYMQRTLN